MKSKKGLIILSCAIFVTFIFVFVRMTYSVDNLSDSRFPDQNFYQCVISHLETSDYDSNGIISDEALANLMQLDCSHKEIESATGLELLTGLTDLRLQGNKLDEINVSNNTRLKYLTLGSYGEYGNNLTEIDVSNNSELSYLYLDYNQLINLDLSKNTELMFLSAQYNQLTSVDVSNNSILERLFLGNNQLTEIDVSNNSKLQYLYLFDNQLTNLNLSNNSELLFLSSGDNQLTSLDLSNSSKLENLIISNNQLTTLDLSNNSKLIMLQCYSNKLTSLDLSNNLELIDLYVSGNVFRSLDLEKHGSLKKIDSDLFGTVELNRDVVGYASNIERKIYNLDSVEVTDGKIGTGYKVKTPNIEYFTVVYGDTTNDGELKINDVTKAYQYLKGKIEMEEYDVVAANVSRSNPDITIADIAKMYQYLKGKINEWE